MQFLPLLVTCSAALAFALPQDPSADVVAAPDSEEPKPIDPNAVDTKPEDVKADDTKPEDVATDALKDFDPSSFIPDRLDKLIPDNITINVTPPENRPLPPPPPPQQPQWQQPWRQTAWRPTPPQEWFQPQPAQGRVPRRCRNKFPNGIQPAVGPTDCEQIVDPWCNPTGQGYVIHE